MSYVYVSVASSISSDSVRWSLSLAADLIKSNCYLLSWSLERGKRGFAVIIAMLSSCHSTTHLSEAADKCLRLVHACVYTCVPTCWHPYKTIPVCQWFITEQNKRPRNLTWEHDQKISSCLFQRTTQIQWTIFHAETFSIISSSWYSSVWMPLLVSEANLEALDSYFLPFLHSELLDMSSECKSDKWQPYSGNSQWQF